MEFILCALSLFAALIPPRIAHIFSTDNIARDIIKYKRMKIYRKIDGKERVFHAAHR